MRNHTCHTSRAVTGNGLFLEVVSKRSTDFIKTSKGKINGEDESGCNCPADEQEEARGSAAACTSWTAPGWERNGTNSTNLTKRPALKGQSEGIAYKMLPHYSSNTLSAHQRFGASWHSLPFRCHAWWCVAISVCC